MKLRDRLAGINANLDDLQSGIEACARAAETLQADARKIGAMSSAPLLRAVAKRASGVQACSRDQLGAMQELRDGVRLLELELKASARPADAVEARSAGGSSKPSRPATASERTRRSK